MLLVSNSPDHNRTTDGAIDGARNDSSRTVLPGGTVTLSFPALAFSGTGSKEETPDHSSLTVLRKRLPQEVFQAAHEVVLEALRTHGLRQGGHLGIDSSVIEANASLSGLVQRNTGKGYWDYGKEPAKAAGVDPEDPAAVARVDRNRTGCKTSLKEWYHPNDPDAKVGRPKDGACDRIYKPDPLPSSAMPISRAASLTIWRPKPGRPGTKPPAR